jgi:hypothetical protein
MAESDLISLDSISDERAEINLGFPHGVELIYNVGMDTND